MSKHKVGEELILNSTNGNRYKVVIVNQNDFREPEMEYAIDIYTLDGKSIYNDINFVSEEFLSRCEVIER